MPHPMPSRPAVVLLGLLALSVPAAFPALGQQPAPRKAPAETSQATPDVAEELVRLNRTLERIAELMESQAEGQRLDLSLRRLAVESERVAVLERDLRTAEATRTSLEDQRFSVRGRLTMLASEVETMPADTPPEHFRGVERMTEEAQRMLTRFQSQMEAQDQRILELQNELTRRRADLQALQDRLDRELDGM